MVEYIVIGGSLGGARAVGRILSQLEVLPVPVMVALHRHASSYKSLIGFLQEFSQFRVVEAQDKLPLLPGTVYVAPADYHLMIENGSCSLSVDAPVLFARPSIDILFESAALSTAIGVLLTGASHDGVAGLRSIKNHGGITVVQSPEYAECAVMPQAAIDAQVADYIVALKDIASMLQGLMLSEST